MTAPAFDDFLRMSIDLTAFGETDLLGTGLAHEYLTKVCAACGNDVVSDLLAAHRAAREDASNPDRSIDPTKLDRALRYRIFSDDRLGPVARNVVKLWYAGMWYGLPTAWTDHYGAHTAAETSTVTSASYQEGLLWPAIGANPQGAKAPGYGSWAQPPRIEPRYLKGASV
jgi:hypothetical protein